MKMVTRKRLFEVLNYDQVFVYLLATILFAYYLVGILESNSISIIGDEFGYWSAGAYFSGLDWTSTTTYNTYYSFGYGLMLTPLFWIFDNSIYIYRAAIILNSVMIITSFFLLYQCSNILFNRNNKKINAIVAFGISFYCGTNFFSKVTMSEIAIHFYFIIICRLLLKMVEEIKASMTILTMLFTVYLYFVHQRMIVVLIAVLICYLEMAIVQNKKKEALYAMVTIILAFIIGTLIKTSYQDNFYYAQNNFNPGIKIKNDFGGQAQKLVYLFSKEGLAYFIKGVLGKLFYLGTSSFLFFYIGLISISRKLISYRRKESFFWFYLFLMLTIAGSIVVSTISTIIFTGRLDLIFYGRYNEYILSIITILGVLDTIVGKTSGKTICFIILIELIMSLFIIRWINGVPIDKFNFSTVIGIADLYNEYKLEGIAKVINIFTIRSILAFFAASFFLYRKKIRIFNIVLGVGCIAITWILIFNDVNHGIFEYRKHEQESNIELANYIKQYEHCDIYYLSSEQYRIFSSYIQFILPDKKIIHISEDDEVVPFKMESVLLTYNRDNEINKKLSKKYIKILESRRYYLWKID